MVIALSLIGGLLVMVLGGELLVRGAVRFAERIGMSPLLIGLTLVGFGTSTPELVASVTAALEGSPGIAYGNIVGGGVTALIAPSDVPDSIARIDSPIMIASSVLLLVLAYAGRRISRADGALMATGYAAYVAYQLMR